MKLSVVILNYNVRYFLELCLKSVQAAITNIDAEVIVVDNHSKDNSCGMVKTLFPDVKLIENDNNLGFSKGNNIGVAHANGEYLCILNPDTVVQEDTFEKLLDFSKSKPDLGAVGCRLIDGTGAFLPESKRNIPVLGVAIKKIFGNSRCYYANQLAEKDIDKVDILVGAFMFLKRKTYLDVGGFDEDYFMYGEDIDLSYRLLKEGYQNYYNGGITVMHYKGESTLRDKTYAKHFYGAMQIFYKKHFKSNVFFDAFVDLGLRLTPYFKKNMDKRNTVPEQYILVSNTENKRLAARMPKLLKVETQIETFDDGTEFILDNNMLNFKKILHIIEKNASKSDCTFKILPKNSNFILGSNSANGRGEVIEY